MIILLLLGYKENSKAANIFTCLVRVPDYSSDHIAYLCVGHQAHSG